MSKKSRLLVLPTIEKLNSIVEGLSKPVDVTKGNYHKLEIVVKNNILTMLHDGVDLKEFSSVWISSFWGNRDLAYAVRLYLDKHDVHHTHVEEGTSKISDQVKFSLSKIISPNTYFTSSRKITKHIDRVEQTCGYPLIIKDVKGSRARFSCLVHDREELLIEYAKLPRHKKFFFQQYIPNDYDWGVLVANGNIVSAEKSYSEDFRNNAIYGANEVFVELKDIPQEIIDIALKSSEALGLSWSRSDIIVDKESLKPYLLEVNRFPGITSDTTEITGAREFLTAHLSGI